MSTVHLPRRSGAGVLCGGGWLLCFFYIEMRLCIGYRIILAPLKDMARRHSASWGRGRCPRAGLQPIPGRLGYQSPGIMTGAGGASLDWDRRRRVTPVQTTSQEAWPEAEPLGWNNSLR